MSVPENPLPPGDALPPDAPPPALAEDAQPPLRLPVENPPWSFWDVVRVALLALLAITLFGSMAIGIAGRGLTTAQMQGLERDPLVVVPAELAADILVVAFMVWLLRSRGLAFWRGVQWNFPATRWAGYVAVGALLAIAVQAASALLPIPKELPIDRYFSSTAGAYLMAFFGVAVAPLVEELFFRGFLYPVIARRLGMGAGVVLTAIAFAFIHESQLARAWAPLLLLFVVGLVLTGVRAQKHSVGATWLMHAGYNGALFTLLYFASDHFRHLEKLT